MKKYLAGFILIISLILTGCSFGASFESQLSKVLADVHGDEKAYRNAQKNLSKIEKAEQQLFTETMALTQEDEVELKKNVEKLHEMLAERLELLNEEESSIKEAKDTFSAFDVAIKKAQADEMKNTDELKVAMDKRYENHGAFVVEYKKLTTAQKELYEMLVNEQIGLADLEVKVDEVNEQNEAVQLAVNTFNESTEVVNSLQDKLFVHTDKE